MTEATLENESLTGEIEARGGEIVGGECMAATDGAVGMDARYIRFIFL